MKKINTFLFLLTIALSAQAFAGLSIEESKAVKCTNVKGDSYELNYPEINLDMSGQVPVLTTGPICYVFTKANTESTYRLFSKQSISTLLMGPNISITLFEKKGPLAFVADGLIDGYDSERRTAGDLGGWAPYQITDAKKARFTCELSEVVLSNCAH